MNPAPSEAQSLSVVQIFEQAFCDWSQPASENAPNGMHVRPEAQSELVLHCVLALPGDVLDELQAAGATSRRTSAGISKRRKQSMLRV